LKRKRKTMKRRRSTRCYKIQKGGDDNTESPPIKEEQKKEFSAYMNAMIEFINKKEKTNTEEMKYSLFKDKFAEFEKLRGRYEKSEPITLEDFKLVKILVYLIIKDEVSDRELLFNKNVAGFQTMINNFIMNLINDSPFEEKVVMKLLEGIVNKKPYVKVSYDKNTNNFIFDVNELLANIKNELTSTSHPDANRYIYQKAIKMKSNIEAVPP